MTKYHEPSSCNKCGKGINDFIGFPVTIESHLCETKTKCIDCGFEDYWAYGWFDSSCCEDGIESKCDTYETNRKIL